MDTTNFVDATSTLSAGTNGCSVSVTSVSANDGIDGFCIDTVTGVGNGYTKGADDTKQDWSEYKVLTGGANASTTVNFVSSGNADEFAVAIKPAQGCIADDAATVTQIATTATSVPFGIISPNTFYQGCQDLIVSTNAGNGYSVTVQESSAMKTANGQFAIPDTTCDAGDCSVVTATTWVTPTKNGFGHTCFNQSGSDCNPTYGSGQKFMPLSNIAAGNNGASILFVQGKSNAVGGCGSGSSCALAFTSSNTAGNLIIVAAGYGSNAAISSVIDTAGDTFVTSVAATTPGGLRSAVWYAQNIKGGANTVTVNYSANNYNDLYILEYSGIDKSSPQDVTSSGNGTGQTLSSGAATTNVANELIFGYGNTASGNSSAGSSFTSRIAFDGNIAEDKIAYSAGSYTATASLSISADWSMIMSTFKATQGVGQTIMSNTGTVTNSTGRVKYRLSAGAAQPAGTYTTIISYTIYATY